MLAYVSTLTVDATRTRPEDHQRLRDVGFDDLGILQSGNAVFCTGRTDHARLAKDLENGIRKAAGIDVTVILRTAEELREIIARNPLPDAAQRDPSRLVVVFLSGKPRDNAISGYA